MAANSRARGRGKKRSSAVRRLERLIEQATVDAYNESEQETGFLTMIEGHVRTPFPARVVGEEVEVQGFDQAPRGTVLAIVRRKGHTYRIDILELTFTTPRPSGFEWIEAYAHWARGNG